MSEAETLGILDEIEALVSDKLQVVSYKWLSRNFLVSSDTAKRLLLEFVQSHEDGLQVVYSLSGSLKNNPSNYSVRLVPGPKLEEAKEDFNGCCLVQVYSIQACIPKDPATIRNAEFVQAEELFGQPATVVNCFRDNRFCGISNSFTRRDAEGTSFIIAGPQLNSLRASGSSSNCNVAKDVKANGEAQICARKAGQLSSDDEAEEVSFRRTFNSESGRKRRVVFDFSDEENECEDAVNLASHDSPKACSFLASKEDQLKEKKPNFDFGGPKEDILRVKKEKSSANDLHQEEISAPDAGRKPAVSTVEEVQSSEINSNGKMTNAVSTSPKRKKMLKTRIDEHGREVTEVVWEGEEMRNSKADSTTMMKGNSETLTDTRNRPPGAKKPPSAVSSGHSNAAGKAGNKKVGGKDPKQGNILSFFKRV